LSIDNKESGSVLAEKQVPEIQLTMITTNICSILLLKIIKGLLFYNTKVLNI